ncbi:Hsp20/alpha crystallin family protein [Jannaschia sp. LMIT008]|uniref:Hsp20/alpha crystallin family protein n=1 Tax=Jannaschia maritima TaxID=3032585 RepID=UPI0028115009|nr:Hsp20/alpha crystallin family protein [Jannaschia sp. LMIT008]
MADESNTPQEHESQAVEPNEPEADQARGEGQDAPQDDGSKMPAEAEGAGEPTRDRPTFRPRCDIVETEDGLAILADMPGAKADTLEVHVEKRELSIRAEVEEQAPDGMSLAIREYRTGDWERRFSVSRAYDLDGVSASLKDGVLTLTLPKVSDPESKRIDVSAG